MNIQPLVDNMRQTESNINGIANGIANGVVDATPPPAVDIINILPLPPSNGSNIGDAGTASQIVSLISNQLQFSADVAAIHKMFDAVDTLLKLMD